MRTGQTSLQLGLLLPISATWDATTPWTLNLSLQLSYGWHYYIGSLNESPNLHFCLSWTLFALLIKAKTTSFTNLLYFLNWLSILASHSTTVSFSFMKDYEIPRTQKSWHCQVDYFPIVHWWWWCPYEVSPRMRFGPEMFIPFWAPVIAQNYISIFESIGKLINSGFLIFWNHPPLSLPTPASNWVKGIFTTNYVVTSVFFVCAEVKWLVRIRNMCFSKCQHCVWVIHNTFNFEPSGNPHVLHRK